MEIQTYDLSWVMRQIVSVLDNPVKIILLVLLILSIVFVGELIAEFIQRNAMKINVIKMIDDLKDRVIDPINLIKKSNLLPKQKRLLLEITKHKNLSKEMRESLSISLLEEYEDRQNLKIKRTDLITKLGPVFGLLGTLIPLGPGIIALGQGDTATLSSSLLAAFDTTVIGLISGSICTILTLIRKRWYTKDKIMLNLLMEAIVRYENNED